MAVRSSLPHDFIAKVVFPEHRIHHLAQVRIGFVVTVQVDAASFFENASNLKHPLHHKRDVGRYAVAVRIARSAYQPVSTRAGDLQLFQPILVDARPKAPDIRELGGPAFLVGILQTLAVCRVGIVHVPILHQLPLYAPLVFGQTRFQSPLESLFLAKRRIDTHEIDAGIV